MLRLDHAIIAVNDLDAAMNDFSALGFTVRFGGVHAGGATHNALICFRDGTYLELMAPTGQPAKSGAADYSFLFANGEGFAGMCLLSDNLLADVEAIRGRGATAADPTEGGRKRPDGVPMRWRSSWIDGQSLPFVMQDLTPRALRVPVDPAATRHDNGALGIAGANVVAGSDALLGRFDGVFGASVGFGLGWAEYDCGGAIIRLEFGGARDALTRVLLDGLDTTLDSHGAHFVGR